MLPFPQEQTEPPFASPALQFPTLCLLGIILQQLWMREGSAAGLLLNAALQKGGEGGERRKFHRKFKYFITSCLYRVCQHLAPAVLFV